ncbi:MAG: outer membrane lipoprotein-sorting protein [Flavobacteriales bacterium]|nr:outer membrane lipoprotein-sorting protein [Flavobacteriales bacterium]
MNKLIITLALLVTSFGIFGQSAEEIIKQSIDATGGANWEKVNSLKYSANLEQGGMKIPLEVVAMRDGRTYTKINIQGMEMIQGAFDGNVLWNTNFMTQKPEKATAEDTENTKRSIGDFPTALHNYKKAGYKVSTEGEETVDGVVCYKIKMEKKPVMVDGVEVPNIEYYFIDKDTKALIMMESEITSGEMKGVIAQSKFSDYQEVNGVYISFSQTMGIKDGDSQSLTFDKVEVNPQIDENTFSYKGE